jgi:hypothetical protein
VDMKCENTLMKDRELWTAWGKHINVVRLPAVMLRDGVDTYSLCRSGVAFPGRVASILDNSAWIRLAMPSCRPLAGTVHRCSARGEQQGWRLSSLRRLRCSSLQDAEVPP